MSMADYVVASHHVVESMPAEQLPQEAGRRWVGMRLGNTLRVHRPGGTPFLMELSWALSRLYLL